MRLKIYTLAFILVQTFSTRAQMPGWDWAVRAGGTYGEVVPEDMVTDANGNIYVCGFYGNAYFGSTYYSSVGNSDDFFLAKYDASGNVLWVKHAGGKWAEDAPTLAIDHEGNVYVAGSFESDSISFDNITIHNYSPWYDMSLYDIYDAFIVKYDASGNAVWAKSIGGLDHEWSTAIAVDENENVYVSGGSFSSSIVLDSLTLNSTSVFLVKYDSLGNRVWVKKPSSGGFDFWLPKTDGNGNLYVTGSFSTSYLTIDGVTLYNTAYPYNGETGFLIKYNSEDSLLWAKASSGGGGIDNYGITIDDDNNVYITGIYYTSSDSVVLDSVTLPNGKQTFLIKYDSSGDILWTACDGTPGVSSYMSKTFGVDADHNIYLTGDYEGDSITFGNTTLINTDTWSDIFFVKYDNTGNFLWARSLPARLGFAYLTPSAAIDNSGHCELTGYFQCASLNFGSTTLSNYYTALYNINLFLARLNDTLSCSANFTLEPDSLLQHHYWAINNSSGAEPLHYNWNWGDGTYDTIAYPSHTYAAEGFYTICLTISDATGCSDHFCQSYDLQKLSSEESENTMIVVNVVDSIPDIATPVQSSGILQACSVYPNPAEGSVFINYSLSASVRVSIDICDALNNKLQRIENDIQSSGEHQLPLDTHKLSNGVYFLVIKAGDETTRQVLVVSH